MSIMKIGILGAEQQETALLQDVLNGKMRKIATATFYEGSIGELEVVLVHSGIGKVNAAIATQILITEFKVDYVINTGVAGSLDPSLNIFDVVCSIDAIEHDVDASYPATPRKEAGDPWLVCASYAAGSGR